MHHYYHLYIMYILVSGFAMTVVRVKPRLTCLHFSSTGNYSAYKNNWLDYIHSTRVAVRIPTKSKNTRTRLAAPLDMSHSHALRKNQKHTQKRCSYENKKIKSCPPIGLYNSHLGFWRCSKRKKEKKAQLVA